MLRFPCPHLSNIALLLREQYDARFKMILRAFPDDDLLKSEYEIIRLQRVMTRHRRRCAQCKLREVPVVAMQLRQLSGRAFSIDMAS